jgi:hypothetical protein
VRFRFRGNRHITGNGKWIAGDPDAPLNGKSACAYSGQQDDPVADQGTFKGDRTRSWGQVLSDLKVILIALGLHPGQACNPTKSGGEP